VYDVHFFSSPAISLKFIGDNLDKNIIVLLDIQFSASDKEDGHTLLAKIRSMSELIPVILWSGINETTEKFSDFINNDAFGFITKSATLAESWVQIDKAISFFKTSIDNIIEDWILNKEDDKDKPVYITSNGQSLSLNDILREIRFQTEIGKDFSRKLNALTIDLLLRKKEELK
jgi:DNA-binding NtrC family response regulator